MAKRVFNEPFLMVPYSLLRIPEYGRYFDGAPLGFLYRLLMTGIRRKSTEGLRYYKEDGWVTELSKRYEKGELASYFTLSDIGEATGFTVRHIRDFIKKLEELKLAVVEEFNGGYIFILGKRLSLETDDGYSIGEEHEGFFIDAWETWAQKDREGFRVFIVENLASPKAKEKLLGKILPSSGKNFSESEEPETVEEEAPAQENPVVEEAPRIDKERIDLLHIDDRPSILEELYARIQSEPNWKDAEKAAAEAMKEGASLSVVNSRLAPRVPTEYSKYARFPRFANKLHFYETTDKGIGKASHIKLANMWKSLVEDVTGANYGEKASFYTEVMGAYKRHLVSKYSFEQCLWTLKRAIANEAKLRFLVQGGRNLITLVHQHSKEYHELREQAMRDERRSKPKPVEKEEKREDLKPVEGFDLLDSMFEGKS